jgi:hypothetical protein
MHLHRGFGDPDILGNLFAQAAGATNATRRPQ